MDSEFLECQTTHCAMPGYLAIVVGFQPLSVSLALLDTSCLEYVQRQTCRAHRRQRKEKIRGEISVFST